MGQAQPDDRRGLTKRSLTIAGHATSLTLEEPFWRELKRLAAAEGKSLAGLVAEIDATRTGNLSSALRVHVLERALGRSVMPEASIPSSS
jgi:predicted DNA-binding ribbon-helix-helix protein